MKSASKRLWKVAFAIALAMFAVPDAFAERTHNAYLADLRKTAVEFKAFSDESVDFKDAQTASAANLLLKQTLGLFPATEEIDYEDRKLPVDNSWIASGAATFARETDPEKRKEIIIAIGQRLESIAVHVEGLEYAEERQTTKDEEKRRLAEILKREEYRPADEGTESPAARLYRAIESWISSLFPRFKPPDPNKRADLTGLRTVLQVLIFVVVAILLVYLLAKYSPRLIGRFRKKSTPAGKRLILGEEIGPDATTANLFAEAESLAGTGDIRGAIRKGYISLLFELNERRMIGLAKHKTNRDYLRDLNKHKQVRANVGGLTVNYERHWYGRQDAVDEDWKEFRKGYLETLNK